MYPYPAAPLPDALMPTTEAIIDRLLIDLDDKQLGSVASRIDTLRTDLARKCLLELLRKDSAALYGDGLTDCPDPVTSIRFGTSNDDCNPVCWSDNAVAVHRAGETSVETLVDYAGTDVETPLRDYSSFTDPVDGSRLIVDLATGEFTIL
ncbi:hypothetical protein ACIBEA_39315 [Streptomyces sp. NPDC051555]|uniref:hypothetical protein n=1 Tax=Streptomyces sp. NPDC051555 TaxID=3365657 RepID=UPI003799AD17